VRPGSLAPPGSTGRSSTGTATCWRRSTPSKPNRASERAGPAITRASLQADLLAAHERAVRLHTRIQHLEKRLSEVLGDHAWRESGLGAPADIDALNQKIIRLEQQVIDLRLQLEERAEDLTAARATNRELMTRLNMVTPASHEALESHSGSEPFWSPRGGNRSGV
jgi:chromosome segregation ATPase